MDALVFVIQLVGGLVVLLPFFLLRGRYKTSKWFFE